MSTTPETGFVRGLDESQYHADPRLSSHRLGIFKRSPQHFRHALEHPSPSTPAMIFGSQLHARVLEPQRYAERMQIVDMKSKSAKAYKDAVADVGADWVALAHEAQQIEDMRASVIAHPTASKLLEDCSNLELSAFWEQPTWCSQSGEETSVQMKARLDGVMIAGGGKPGGTIVDLKTTRDASPREFGKAVHNYGYLLQAAVYVTAARACLGRDDHLEDWRVVLIAAEKEAPYAIACYEISGMALRKGMAEVEDLLSRFATCQLSGEWPGYTDGIEPVVLPPWA